MTPWYLIMIAITFIQQGPNQDVREKELASSLVKAHAARIKHGRRHPGGRRKSAEKRDKASPKKTDMELPLESIPTAYKGNSDLFNCFDIRISPELNQVLTFCKEVAVRAHYMPLAIRKMSDGGGWRFEESSVSRAWNDIESSLLDEGVGLARLVTYSQYLSYFLHDPRAIALLNLQMRARSLQLLRKKLESHNGSSSIEETTNLKRHVFGLFDAECLSGDTAAARTHGRALQRLANASNGVDVPMAHRLLYIICHAAAKTGRRTLSEVSEWITTNLEIFLEKTVPPFMFGCFENHVLHPTITLPQLQKIFTRRWYLVDATTRMSQADGAEAAKLGVNKDVAYMYVAFSSLIDMSRLNDLYHNLVDGVWMADASTCERFTEAAISVALNYLTRRMYGDLTINGVDLHDSSDILMRQLKMTFKKAYQYSTFADRCSFASTYLWILFVGALCEQRKQDSFLTIEWPDKLWFAPLLICQARMMGLVTWPQMLLILRQFLYTSIVEPRGSIWFEDLVKRYHGITEDLEWTLSNSILWCTKKDS